MPQIGWFEILVICVLAILIIGPKDFPIMIKKVLKWSRNVKSYFNDIRSSVSNLESDIEKQISLEEVKETKKDNKDNEQ